MDSSGHVQLRERWSRPDDEGEAVELSAQAGGDVVDVLDVLVLKSKSKTVERRRRCVVAAGLFARASPSRIDPLALNTAAVPAGCNPYKQSIRRYRQ